jgi:hypothetical protein
MEQRQQEYRSELSHGTSQYQRMPAALDPAYVRLDDRSPEALMAFSAEFARLIRYYNPNLEVSGAWDRFLYADVSVVLASMITTDLDRIEAAHQQQAARIHPDALPAEMQAALGQMLEGLRGTFERFDVWYRQLERVSTRGNGLEGQALLELHNLIEGRVREWFQIWLSYLAAFARYQALQPELEFVSGYHPVWQAAADAVQPADIFKGKTPAERMLAAALKIRLLHRAVMQALSHVVIHFRQYFDDSLASKADHKPDIGLFIAFLEMFRYAQEDMNRVVARHLDLYYRHYLRQTLRPGIADQAHVVFALSEHLGSFLLPKGTLLSAGMHPDGTPLEFRTLDALEVNKSSIAQLKTLHISRYAKIETTSYQLVTGMYAAPVANSRDGLGTPFDEGTGEWPTFGEEQAEKSLEARKMVPAGIGFSVASPVLYLEEGSRQITLRLNFAPESTDIYRKLLQDLKDSTLPSQQDPDLEAFYRIFPRGDTSNLSVFLTTSEGWRQVQPASVRIDPPSPWSDAWIAISFRLPPSFPAVTGFQAALYPGERYATRHPMLKVLLSHEIEPFAYSFLRECELSSIDIEVEVDRVRKLALYNELGQLDSRQSFQPFGPLPLPGSALIIGCAEIFRKSLQRLSLHYEWQNLPRTAADFDAYYADYGQQLQSRAYQTALSALSGGEYHPGEKEPKLGFPLFSADPEAPKDTLTLCRIEPLDLGKLKLSPDPGLEQLEPFDSQARNGYLRLELTGPQEGFGHQMFQKLFAETVTANASAPPDAQRPVPNPPIAPSMKSLHLSYSASATVELGRAHPHTQEQLYHVHPFGLELAYSKGEVRTERPWMLPQYHEDGYLFIGIAGLQAPQPLTLFFQLTASKTRGHTRFTLPEVRWQYLVRNRWVPFRDEHHLADTTDRFTRTGIVKLHIPSDISARNDILPGGLHWICVSVDGDTEVLCHALEVHAQTVLAERMPDTASGTPWMPLPARAIAGLKYARPEIQSVLQPFPSFGGKAPEDEMGFFVRVSERLRHKQRAITAWDVERMVLDQFPMLAQVKCLSHLSHPDFYKPDDGITVVVVPRISDSTDPATPKVNYQTLYRIEQYLRAHASAFLKVRVRNPEYEYIRLYGNIRFEEGFQNGQTLLQLYSDLKQMVCPWMENPRAVLALEGSVSEDGLLNFIRSLPYVRFVTRFSLLHITRQEDDGRYTLRDTAAEKGVVSVIQAKPWAVIIPDDDHQMQLVEKETEREPEEAQAPIRFQGRLDISKDAEHIKITARERRRPVVVPRDSGDTYSLTIRL